MSLDNLEMLLIEQLQDLYYAEQQLVKALPKLADAANAPELQQAFTDHCEETKGHVSRLEEIFEALGVDPKAKQCPAMDGLIKEGSEMMAEEGEPSILDAGLIASAQRVEHYEIAAYGNMKVFADQLGREDVVALLDATLDEEQAADARLTGITVDDVLPSAPLVDTGNGGVKKSATPKRTRRRATGVR